MENKKTKSLIIILIILIIVLTGYIIYDKLTEKKLSCVKNEQNQLNDNNQEETGNNNNQLNNNDDNGADNLYNNIYGVYGIVNETGESYLLLWPDNTYKYTYNLKDKNHEGYLGTYKIENNYLVLNNMFEIDYDSNITGSEDVTTKVITEMSNIKIKINSKEELYDENNNVTLSLLNQPFGPDNDFYSNLKGLLK